MFKKTHIEKVFESFREFSTQHWDVYIEFIYAINVHQQFVLVVIFLLTVLVESPCCVKYFVESVWVDAVCLKEYLLNIAWLVNFVLKDILYRFYKTFKNFKTKSTRNPVLSPKNRYCSNSPNVAIIMPYLWINWLLSARCHFEIGTKINCLLLMIQMCVYVRMQTYLYLLIVLLENIPKLVYFLHCM